SRPDALTGVETLEGIQFELVPLAVRVAEQEAEDQEHRDVAGGKDQKEPRHLCEVEVGSRAATKLLDQDGEKELERVNVEENDEDQNPIHPDDEEVLQTIAAEEDILLVPDREEEREADRERDEALHGFHQLGVALRNFERDDQKCHRESEDRVG